MGWQYMWIFLIVSAVLCAIGFKKFVWFLSIGYGFSVAGLGIAYLVTALTEGFTVSFLTFVQGALFLAYGIRLSGFLLVRELKNASYRKVLKDATKDGEKKMPFFVKFSIWVCVAVLYIAQTSPMFFRVYNGDGKDIILPLIGCVISVAGSLPNRLPTGRKAVRRLKPENGRHKRDVQSRPLSEIFRRDYFLDGSVRRSLNTLTGIGQWLTAAIGYVCIVYIMINGAQRLDKRQEKSYGAMPEYRAYADNTPIIIPLLPVYHIGKYKDR